MELVIVFLCVWVWFCITTVVQAKMEEEYGQILEITKQLKNLTYFAMLKDGNTIYINPAKIMWFEPRISE